MILFALLREEKPNNRWRKYSCRDSTKWGECLTPKTGTRRAQKFCTDHKKRSPPPPPPPSSSSSFALDNLCTDHKTRSPPPPPPSSSSFNLGKLHKEKPNKPWCKYSCRECGEDFKKWGQCLAHLIQSGHMGRQNTAKGKSSRKTF